MLAHLSSNLSEFLSRYHLKDVIVGKIYFLLVRIKIKHMELAIIKRETTGTGTSFIVIMVIQLLLLNLIVQLILLLEVKLRNVHQVYQLMVTENEKLTGVISSVDVQCMNLSSHALSYLLLALFPRVIIVTGMQFFSYSTCAYVTGQNSIQVKIF